ncbi:ATP-binding cassette domain-containing protein [Cohnella caldifontis]|uniref:ATP-binding cassette domain-containing protein n=1 Tax=Cohnella caldifontis TaxID=3027471 RepID=UPI0023EA8DAC|nr:ATP-binding cassette domain-containing protein [Cohnella sp. YIM B05605]
METFVMRTRGLTKRYGSQAALDQVDLSVRRGSIYGFIGQNGAGKTTLMRIVGGLTFPTSGTVELFGETDAGQVNEARARIGITIERPALFPAMTAAENLEVHRLQKGIADRSTVRDALDIVGLQDTGRKPAGQFSLGMKQRLDLAIALLGRPELLILDEPANGLDPVSVVELRELLRRLNRETGLTIVISSHILSELHLLATHYGIIHQGRLLEESTAEQLNARCRRYLHIKVDDPARAVELIGRELRTADFELLPDGSIRLYEAAERPGKWSAMLAAAGLEIEQFMPMGESLESYYVRRIGGETHAPIARG